MSKPNIAVYAEGALGPRQIAKNLPATQQAGWTTIILGLFHIGYPPDWPEAAIYFNDPPPIIDGGKYLADTRWPDYIAQLKQNSSITKIYASFGGWGVSEKNGVQDFTTIHKIYEKNQHSFEGTLLKKSFEVFRQTFPAIDGIDMDCEDFYDKGTPNSFVAFCEMVIHLGFDVTFCPFQDPTWWADKLQRLQSNFMGDRVKWWNLQCYDGGDLNEPQTWAKEIARVTRRSTDGYILAGDWSRFWDPGENRWRGRCPESVKAHISPFKQQPCFGGAFIWNMDSILTGGDWSAAGCASKTPPGMRDYIAAIQ